VTTLSNRSELITYSLSWVVIAPVLMLSTTLYNSLVAGVLLIITLLLYAISCAVIRKFIIYYLRLPTIVFIAGTIATILDLSVKAWNYELAIEFGIYLPLIAFNGFLYSLSEEYFLRQTLVKSLQTTLICGLVFFIVLCLMGMIRELLVYGSFFKGFPSLHMTISDNFNGLNMFRQAPGALLCAGTLLAFGRFYSLNGNRDEKLQSTKVFKD